MTMKINSAISLTNHQMAVLSGKYYDAAVKRIG